MTSEAEAYRDFYRSSVSKFAEAAKGDEIALSALLPNTIFRSGDYYIEGEFETSLIRSDALTPDGTLGGQRMFLPVRTERMALIAKNVFERIGERQRVSVVYVSDAVINTQVGLFLETKIRKPDFRRKLFICDKETADLRIRDREYRDIYSRWDTLTDALQEYVAERRSDGDFVIIFLAVDRTLIFPMGPMDEEYDDFLHICLQKYLRGFVNSEFSLPQATPYNIRDLTEWVRENYLPYSKMVSPYASDYDVLAFVLLCLSCGLVVRDEFVSRHSKFRATFRGEGSFVEAMNVRVNQPQWGLFEEPNILGPLKMFPSLVWNAEKLRGEINTYGRLIESHLSFNHAFRNIQNRELFDYPDADNPILNRVLIDGLGEICEKKENLFVLGFTDMPARAVGLKRTDEGTAIHVDHTDAAFLRSYKK